MTTRSRLLSTVLMVSACDGSPNPAEEVTLREDPVVAPPDGSPPPTDPGDDTGSPGTEQPLPPDLIYWTERPITWDDFVGTVDPTSEQFAVSFVGSTPVIGVQVGTDGVVTITGAETVFDPTLSWAQTEGRTDELLAHEQGHFDLEEAVTRGFRISIEQAATYKSGTDLDAAIADSLARFSVLRDVLHDAYDAGTSGGLDPVAQGEWELDIDEMLAEPHRLLFHDDFDNVVLTDGWTWTRENPSHWLLTGDALHIDLEWGDLWEGWTNNCENLLLRETPLGEEWTVDAHLQTSLVAHINQALIVLYGDDDNYLRYGLIRLNGDPSIFVNHVHEIAGGPQPQTHTAHDGEDVYLRIVRRGSAVTMLYSDDGSAWQTHATIDDLAFEISNVGIVAFDGSEPTSDSTAEYLDFEARMGAL